VYHATIHPGGEDNLTAQKDHRRLAWYEEAKFGLFIHWGAYTVAGAEASWPLMSPELTETMYETTVKITEKEYVALPARFNPVEFNADDWVRMAKEAGIQYIIITSKHCDGFCMFDAPGTDYKITKTPFGRDVCLELSQACARSGLRLGFYYSPIDLHHPGYRDTRKPSTATWTGEPQRKEWGSYLDYMESHIRKLLTDYGDVAVIWFDGVANHGKYDPDRFHKLIHELNPNTLINDRLGEGYDYITPEQFIPRKGIPVRSGKPLAAMDPNGDKFWRTICTLHKIPLIKGWLRKQGKKYYGGGQELTPIEKEPYPSPERFQPWETCMTMGKTWAFNPTEKNWKAPAALLRNLVEVASGGGNLLLNVGPTSHGTFPPEAVERLAYISRWMKTYNPTIYGATYTPLLDLPWGCASRNSDKLYLHIFNWPPDGKLVVENFPGSVKTVRLFAGDPLNFSLSGRRLEIAVPVSNPDPDVSVLTVEIDPAEKGWSEYSVPAPEPVKSKK
jgi:alpha-L-fucosidase